MNPYESPTHCEEQLPTDLTALWVLIIVAFWPVVFVLVLPAILVQLINECDDLGNFFQGFFWAAVLAIDVAFGWTILIHFVLRFLQ